jgi:tetratricopeptide (TPR) repeat protein
MKKISIILFAIAFAIWQSGCTTTADNTNNNTSSPTATPTATTNNNSNQTNSNVANANSNANATAKKDETVPTFTDANTALTEGNKYFDADNLEKAIDAFKQAAKLNPDLAEAYFKLGVSYALIEKKKEQEVELVPNQPIQTKTPKKNKEVLVKKDSDKAFAEAVKAYKKIIAKNPKDDTAHFNLGRSYNKLNEDKEAEKSLRQAVKLKPDDSEYQTELGAILIKFAKYDEAVGVLKKALKLDETNSQAQSLMEKAEAGKKRINYGIPKDKAKADK